MKIWERIIEARLRDVVEINKQQYGFIPGKRNYWCHVCLKNVNGKVQGRSKRALLFIRGPRESLQQNSKRRVVILYEKIKNSGKVCATCLGYLRGKKTVVRCAVETTESFKVKVGLHQGSGLSPFLFAVIMNRLTDKVRKEPPWTMVFANNIVICEETRQEVEWRLECWRYAFKRRGMKLSRSKKNICA